MSQSEGTLDRSRIRDECFPRPSSPQLGTSCLSGASPVSESATRNKPDWDCGLLPSSFSSVSFLPSVHSALSVPLSSSSPLSPASNACSRSSSPAPSSLSSVLEDRWEQEEDALASGVCTPEPLTFPIPGLSPDKASLSSPCFTALRRSVKSGSSFGGHSSSSATPKKAQASSTNFPAPPCGLSSPRDPGGRGETTAVSGLHGAMEAEEALCPVPSFPACGKESIPGGNPSANTTIINADQRTSRQTSRNQARGEDGGSSVPPNGGGGFFTPAQRGAGAEEEGEDCEEDESPTSSSSQTSVPPPRRTNTGDELEGPLPNELELLIPRFRSRFIEGTQALPEDDDIENLTIYSEWKVLPSLRFRLMVHPLTPPQAHRGIGGGGRFQGVGRTSGGVTPHQAQILQSHTLGAFVEIGSLPDWPADWIFQCGVRFHIYVVNLTEPARSAWKDESFQFSSDETDRGWHNLLSYLSLLEDRFLDARSGDLLLRAAVYPSGNAVMSRSLRTPCPPSPLPPRKPSSGGEGRETGTRRNEDLGADEEWEEEDDKEDVLGPCVGGGTGTSGDRGGRLSALTALGGAPVSLGRAGKGYVGLKNHGATCYMNALLQSLYYIGKFRQAVYAMSFDARVTSGSRSVEILEGRRKRRKRRANTPGGNEEGDMKDEMPGKEDMEETGCTDVHMEEEDARGEGAIRARSRGSTSARMSSSPLGDSSFCSSEESEEEEDFSDWNEQDMLDLLVEEEQEQRRPPSISLALQNLFFRLYTSSEPVACKDLIRSFGWDAADAFTQQDTHELLKLLLDKVEEQMQGTPAEGSVKRMFEGEMETYIECIEVDYKSARKETFEDLNLDVKGCSGVVESLRRLVQPEVLEGENSYDAEQYGKQRAKKGVRFLRFPPVCIFLLKRFDFDYEKMDTVKVFSSFEFTRDLDLSEFCPDAGVYELHAVSVHQGDVNSGHYYCFLRPPPRTQWIRFDDDKVYPVSEYAAIGDNFGGEEEEPCNYLAGRMVRSRSKLYNAYILVYVKKSQANQLLADCSPLKVNPQVVSRCRTEELLMRLRNRIRKVLEQRIKVKVYHPLQFINRRFLDLPLATLPPLLEIKSNRSVHIFPIYEQIVSKLWAKMYSYHPAGAGTAKGSPSSRGGKQSSGGGGSTAGGNGGESPENSPTSSPSSSSSSTPPPVGFVLHVVDLATTEDPRFQAFELSENPTLGEIYRDKVSNGRSGAGRLLPGSSTPSSSGILGGGSGGGSGTSGALGGVLSRFDACLHFLAVPEKSTIIRSFADHDEFCRKHQLLFLKYFDVFNANRALWENQKGLEFLVDKKPPGGGGEGGGEDQERGTTGAASSIGGGEGSGSSPGSVDHTIPEVLRDSNILCLDVMHVPGNWKLFCLQPHIYRCLLRAMDDGLVRPYAVEPLRRYIASLGTLPPLFSAGPDAPSLFYPFVRSSSSENREEDVKMSSSAAAVSPGQCRTTTLSPAASTTPSQSKRATKGVAGGEEEAFRAEGRGKTAFSPTAGGDDKIQSFLVDVSTSQSCSRAPCAAAAAAGVGTSMTYADHLHGSGTAGMREGGGSTLPDLPTDPDLAMILALEIEFQDPKSPPNLMLSFKKTLTQEKIYPGDIFVFSLVAPEQLQRRFQETKRVAELEATEADTEVTEEFCILPPAQEGHQVLSRLYQVGRGLASVPFLTTAVSSLSLQNAFGRSGGSGTSPGGGLRGVGTATGGSTGGSAGSPGEATGFTSLLESTPGSSKAVSPNNPWGNLAGTQTAPPTPPAATGAAAEALSTAAATAAGDAGVPLGAKKADSGKQSVTESGGLGQGDTKEGDDGSGRNGQDSKGSGTGDKPRDDGGEKRGEEVVAGGKKGETSGDKLTGDSAVSQQGGTSPRGGRASGGQKESPFFLTTSHEGEKDRLSAAPSVAPSEVSTAVSSAAQGRGGSGNSDRATLEGRDASVQSSQTPLPSLGGAGDSEKTHVSELSPEASAVLPAGVGAGGAAGGLPLPTSWSLNSPSGGGGGEVVLFLPASRGGYIPPVPPEMPLFPSADFHHYALNRANRFVFQFRLYDPLEMLNRPMNCCGMLLEDYPRPSLAPSFSTVSLLSREAGLSHCPSSDNLTPLPLQSTSSPCQSALGGAGGDNLSTQGVSFCGGTPATPGLQVSTPSPCSSVGASGTSVGGSQAVSLGNVPLTPVVGLQRCGSGGGEMHESGEGTESSGTSGEGGEEDEDPWVHLPKGRPVTAKMLEVDVRVACKQVIRYVSWYMGVDPSRLFLFPEPPLLSDTSFEPLSLDSLVVLTSPNPDQQRRADGGGHHGSQGGGSSQGGGLIPYRLSVNEVFNRLEKKALSSSLRFGRRRPLPRAASVFPASLNSGPQGSRHRVFHLAVLPRHYSLCTRVIEPQLLTSTQQQKMKQQLYVPSSTSSSSSQQQQLSGGVRKPSGGGENSPAPMTSSVENEPVFYFVTLVLNRRVESIGCVEGLIASRCPLSGRPATVQDLIAAALVRMDKSLKIQLAQEMIRARSGGQSDGSSGGEMFSSPETTWSAEGVASSLQQQQAVEAVPDTELASALRVVLSTAAAVQPLERSQQLQNLPFYTSASGTRRQQQGRAPSSTGGTSAGVGEHVAATQNLFSMPLRLELDWTADEKDQLAKGTLKALQVAHQSPSDKEYFGSPFEILVRPDDTLNEIKRKVKEKLLLPKALWNNCTFFQYADCNRSWKGSNDKLDWQRYDRITLIAEHPAPYSKMRSQAAMRIA